MASRIVGIDLGTTHSALAWVDPDAGGAGAPVNDFPVPQVVRPGEVSARALLPSTLYQPAPGELADDAIRLPWNEVELPVVGELARWQGSRVPGRLVASAKSWLCHPGVDRGAPILPWGAPPEVQKLSPVDASALILEHLAKAWSYEYPSLPLGEQEVVITVPASFDEAARALTVTAARKAGLARFTLLEEPQAAFYDFTARHRAELAKVLEAVRLVLVVDVGGGTTDFTLVHVGVSPEGPMMKRVAVGEHLMLGGDNMDAALAHRVEQTLSSSGKRLSAAQWTQLVQQARTAKEALLGTEPPERFGISLLAGGAKLLGGTVSAEVSRAEAHALLVDGFFPRVAPAEPVKKSGRMAIQELGLPYAQDPAVTRHLAAFLRAHAAAGFTALGETGAPGALPRPDAILLNGGVFNSPQLAQGLVDAVSSWWPSQPRIPLLPHTSLDRAVARGAAYYGLVRRGLGRRIGGGAARAFYVGLGAEEGGVSRALCLVPRGFEEGQTVDLGERPFTLTLGRPVQFSLFTTSADRIDKPGEVVELAEDLKPLPPLHTVLKAQDGQTREAKVYLRAGLTEIGTLELWCVAQDRDERWRLEFELRGALAGAGSGAIAVTESMPARFETAREAVERIYGHKPLPVGPKDVKQLVKTLESVLGPKDNWRVPVLRELWSALFAGASKRRRSGDHERVFFQLLGFTLRPGFGYPLDAWRCEQSFRIFKEPVTFHGEKPVWSEFWILWRRIAAGLPESAHEEIWTWARPHLERKLVPSPKPLPKLKGIQPEGLEEMVRAVASLEHLGIAAKEELGGWIADKLRQQLQGGPWAWALGRIGARVPIAGSVHKVVPPETAQAWIALLVELGPAKIDGAPFAIAQLARRTGDRTRDIDEETREVALRALAATKSPDSFTRMVREVEALEAADEARALGDTLPAGLRLA